MSEHQTEEEILALAEKIKARRAEEVKLVGYLDRLNMTDMQLRTGHGLRQESVLKVYMTTCSGYQFSREIKVPHSRIRELIASEIEAIDID